MEREIRDVLTNSVQCDQLWSFVQKKQRRLQPDDPAEWGDTYTFLGLEREAS
jgi:hypothetical protein